MGLREDEAERALKKVYRNGMLSVGVRSDSRRKALKRLLMIGDSDSISGDIFWAINETVERHKEELQKQKERSDEAIVEKAEEIRKKRERGTDKEYLQKLRDEKNG